jgi:hypothetical protein
LNSQNFPFLHIALPVLDEASLLPRLLDCIRSQTYRNFKLYACVNQPEEWWQDPERRRICESNQETLEHLKGIRDLDIVILDKTSPGKGWIGKKHGVGWARKTLMDTISEAAGLQDIILSVDADITFSPGYFHSIAQNFHDHPDAASLAVPYFHKPVDDPDAYRAILRYEIYMRSYSLNLWRIGSPYSFTALGSAMTCPVWAYRAIGGMTPKMSGEDFYFLQKLRKFGKMLFWNVEKVYPEARFSTRVYFGTGPAMIRGNAGDWSSYPVYSQEFFDEIAATYELFPSFFSKTESTRVVKFLQDHLKEADPFEMLRQNTREENQFIRACHEKFDGLRILQYLKYRQCQENTTDENALVKFLGSYFLNEELKAAGIDLTTLSFIKSTNDDLEKIRGFLVKKEEACQISSVPSLPGQQLP